MNKTSRTYSRTCSVYKMVLWFSWLKSHTKESKSEDPNAKNNICMHLTYLKLETTSPHETRAGQTRHFVGIEYLEI